jgi:hypothetical protein
MTMALEHAGIQEQSVGGENVQTKSLPLTRMLLLCGAIAGPLFIQASELARGDHFGNPQAIPLCLVRGHATFLPLLLAIFGEYIEAADAIRRLDCHEARLLWRGLRAGLDNVGLALRRGTVGCDKAPRQHEENQRVIRHIGHSAWTNPNSDGKDSDQRSHEGEPLAQ